jgi:hypothetical protein
VVDYESQGELPKGETTELRVVFESLNADSAGTTNDFKTSNDAHTLGGETRSLLAPPISALLKLVKEFGEGHFFLRSVDMHDTRQI